MIIESHESDIHKLLREFAKEKRFIDINVIKEYSELTDNCRDPKELKRLEYIFNELVSNQDNCNEIIQDILNVNDSTPDYLREPRIRELSDSEQDIKDFVLIGKIQKLLKSKRENND